MNEALKKLKCKVCVTPETSEAVQRAVFAAGGHWGTRKDREIMFQVRPFVFIGSEASALVGRMTYVGTRGAFEAERLTELTPAQVIDLLTEDREKVFFPGLIDQCESTLLEVREEKKHQRIKVKEFQAKARARIEELKEQEREAKAALAGLKAAEKKYDE